MRNITSREAGVMRQDNAGDHRIPQLSYSSFLLSQTSELCGKSSGLLIESHDSMVDAIKQPFEIFRQRNSLLSGRHDLQSRLDFKNGDRVRPDGTLRLPVHPRRHAAIRRITHQRKENIGVQDNHAQLFVEALFVKPYSSNLIRRTLPGARNARAIPQLRNRSLFL